MGTEVLIYIYSICSNCGRRHAARHCEEQRDEAIQNDTLVFIQTFHQSLAFASGLPRRKLLAMTLRKRNIKLLTLPNIKTLHSGTEMLV